MFELLANIIHNVKDAGAKYDLKRIKISFAAVIALAALAGILQLALTITSPNDTGGASNGEIAETAHEANTASAADSTEQNHVTGKTDAHAGKVSDNQDVSTGKNAASGNKTAESKVDAKRAAALKGLILEGDNVTSEVVDAIVTEERNFTKRVEFIDQREVLPSGCEIVALAIALRSMGHDVSPQELADNYVDMSGAFPAGYSGSPYTNGCGLPPCIVSAGESWLGKHAKGYHAHDLTGSDFDALIALVEQGYPVLMWATEGMIDPSDIEEYEGYVWYWPLHCVTAYGVVGDSVCICDSIAGMVEYDRAKLADIYAACGSMSVAMLPA